MYQPPFTIPQNGQQSAGMSDVDLIRLAQLMQQQRGEGLAFVNPGEQALLKALGGAGQPMPGTQGLGPGGGPIRSYADESSGGYSWTGGGATGAPAEKTAAEKAYAAAQQGYDYVTGRPLTSGDSGGGGGGAAAVAPTPTFQDQYGNKFSSKEQADASDAAINAQKTTLTTALGSITADTTMDSSTVQSMLEKYDKLSDEDKTSIFNAALKTAVEESKAQINTFQDAIGKQLQGKTQAELEALQFEGVTVPQGIGRLSEQQQRSLFDTMLQNAVREARFTLTPEEVAEFSRDVIQAAPVADIEQAPQIGEITPIAEGAVQVGEVAVPDAVTIAPDGTPEIDRTNLDLIRASEENVEQMLLDRISGVSPSTAQLQLRQNTEQNLRALLGAQAGAQADPARLRQLTQVFADIQQTATGQAAVLQSQENQAAEQQLVQLYQQQGTRELSLALAQLESDRQIALEQANLDQARNLSIQQSNLTRVLAQAEIDKDTTFANLEAQKQRMIEQGKLDLATALANLEKDLAISRVNADLALRSRALDDALALANYQGQMALEGLEVKVDLAEMEAELQKLGFELQRDLAELDAQTRITVAQLAADAQRYAANSAEYAARISALGTILGNFATSKVLSDVRVKTNIRMGEEPRNSIQEFLDGLQAYLYEYKQPDAPGQKHGEMLGVMAQDLMQSDIGRQMVKQGPSGLQVDYGQGLAAILAAQADLNDRMNALEGRK